MRPVVYGASATTEASDYEFWRDHSTIVLSPVAAPSILGLFGFAAATFMVAANMAGWYGGTDTQLVLFPFALTAGGIAQFLAGMWAYRARDAIATATSSAPRAVRPDLGPPSTLGTF